MVEILERKSDEGYYPASMLLCMLHFAGILVERNQTAAIYYAAMACIQSDDNRPRDWMCYLAYPRGCTLWRANPYRPWVEPEMAVLRDLVDLVNGFLGDHGSGFENGMFSFVPMGYGRRGTLVFKPTGLVIRWYDDTSWSSEDLDDRERGDVIAHCIESIRDSLSGNPAKEWTAASPDYPTYEFLKEHPRPYDCDSFIRSELDFKDVIRIQDERIRLHEYDFLHDEDDAQDGFRGTLRRIRMKLHR